MRRLDTFWRSPRRSSWNLRNFGEQSLSELIDRLREIGVNVPDDNEDRSWRRVQLATLVPTSDTAVGAATEQAQSGEDGGDEGRAGRVLHATG